MTINGIPLMNYTIAENEASLIFQTNDYQAVKDCVGSSITICDGVGNDFIILTGYTKLMSIEILSNINAFKVNLARKTDLEQEYDALRAENSILKSQIIAGQKSTQLLEDCIMELAAVAFN